ncbi:MAG: cytochrome b/b6 domain-containing protein [Pseudomonadales bacterium]|nr:cytochrome b/b6 domain-containing protein [Pseudomonadales bacterium]
MTTSPQRRAESRLVWDLPVRIMHWTLALAVLGSWLTQELDSASFEWHVRCGYVVLVTAVVRVLWGFIGTRHARFRNFVRGPAAIWRYARAWIVATPESATRYVGHNPLGVLAILAMLAMLIAQAVTGLFANDQIFSAGPLFGYVSPGLSNDLTGFHKKLFYWLLAVIALHVTAAFVYLFWKRENLILPMLTGRKSARLVAANDAISGSRLLLWLTTVAVVAGALYWVVQSAPQASLSFF